MVDKANNLREKYHNNVIKTWSDNVYKKYKNSPWRWADLPFRDYINEGDLFVNEYLNQTLTKKVEGKSILEIGSAMGCAYKFMKNSGLIDLSNYTGIEVSKVGIDFCKKIIQKQHGFIKTSQQLIALFLKILFSKEMQYIICQTRSNRMINYSKIRM